MQINDPQTLAEVTAAFNRYESALVTNDVETLDALFWSSAEVVRYGMGENLYGQDEILAFRKARPSRGLARKLTRHSLEEIGGYFGGRDHSTVLYGVGKITELAQSDPSTLEVLRKLESQLGAGSR